jgi:DNA-binding IclR family transcriptional regulator
VLLAFAPPEARDRYLAIHPLEPITAQTITDACALLKEIEMVTAQGYAVDYEEFREGVGCISVPVIDGAFLLGAYTVSAPIDRCRRHKDEFLRILKSAARSVLPPQQHELDGDSDSRHRSQGAESA